MNIKYDRTENPADEDVAWVRKNLVAFNRSQAPEQPQQKIAVYARDEQGTIIGGATGEVTWGWLYVEMLWVHEDYRGSGIGSRLLDDIEQLARKYNVVGFHLGTTDFQALDFYLRCGYEVWGQLPDFPPGHTNYSLRKKA
ncbi:MAG: GNAT family N-acetyltransferase [Gammaproteobacteria bacterium]|nr:GNAT family N-acetyltransferase [Gammaproteobacteria bacterium]NNF60372.1 GNAT family N-acetyltransferase [Gammaproteobacteria bacterium]